MDLTQTLIAAAKADPAAEKHLHEWTASNYEQLATALAAEVAAEGKDSNARTMAALFLKNTLYGKAAATQSQYHDRWKQLAAPSRKQVKDALLQAMTSAALGHFAAVAAAEVAAVELPYQEWPELMGAMKEFMNGTNVQQTALECLGITLERIAEIEELIDIPAIPTETVDQMLTMIVDGVRQDKPINVRLASLKALANSLYFVRKNMQVQAERDFIIRDALMTSTQATDPKMRSLAFSSLDQVAELYYDVLPDYMTQLFELTTTAIRTDPEEEVQMAAIEFWSTLATVEQTILDEIAMGNMAQQCQRYTHSALDRLVPILLETLTKQQEDAEEDEMNLHASGAMCLQTISQTVEDQIISHVMPFVNQNFGHQEWRMRDAAIVAFSCILDGPDTPIIGQYVVASIPVLLQTFADANETVRQSAIHCLSTICRLHATAIQPDQVHKILQALLEKMAEPPRVATYACAAIYNIARSLRGTANSETNLLSTPMTALLQALFQVCDRPDAHQNNLRFTSLDAASELINSSANDVQPTLVQVLPTVVERVESALKLNAITSEEETQKWGLLGMWCAFYTNLMRRLPKPAIEPHADRIMTSLLQILQQPTAQCHDEAFMTVSALADVMEQDFTKYLEHTVPLIVAGIQNFQAIGVCKIAIGTMVDICVNCGGDVQRFADQLMNVLMHCLQDTAPDRSIKPVVISSLGEVAMALQAAYEPYMKMTQLLLMQAAQQPAPSDNEEVLMFVNELRVSVLEAYSGILQGMQDGNRLDLILPWMQNIFPFLQYLAKPVSNRDDAVVVKAVNLIGDVARILGSNDQVKAVFQSNDFVLPLLTECSDVGAAGWAHELVTQCVQS